MCSWGFCSRLFTKEIIQSMNQDAIVFALANPVPETTYEEARQPGLP